MQFDFSPKPNQTPREPDAPMRLLILGDFSGKVAGDKKPLAQRPTLRVDVDNFDTVLAKLTPQRTVLGEPLTFSELDDFHPDALYAKLPVFAALRNTRKRLLDPAQFAQVAAELGVSVAEASTPRSGGDLLADILGGRPAIADAPQTPTAKSAIDALISGIIAPHIVPNVQPQQTQLVASVDAAIAMQMNAVLHDNGFQSLESTWRGVRWLLSNLELDENLQLHLFDVSREELLADIVAAQGRLADCGLVRALVDDSPGADDWSVILGLYHFGPSNVDIAVLAALGLIASQAGGPLLASADTALATAEPEELAGWEALRRSEAAPWIGLAAPRLLMRQPYGASNDPVQSFAFEEFAGEPEHEHLLWGNGALAATLLIGQAFTARGWDMEPGDERQVGDLPAYCYKLDGELQLQACAEDYLGEQAGQALLSAGLIPLLSHRNQSAVTVLQFQSIAHPRQALAGFGER